MTGGPPSFAVVIPTVGRPSLTTLLDRLAVGTGPRARAVVVVDDRASAPDRPVVDVRKVAEPGGPLVVARGHGRGPAAARNVGWQLVPRDVEWVAFLDDDVLPPADWAERLADDLRAAAADPVIAGSQALISVPLPTDRRPTDSERGTAGLSTAWWITADMAYRRDVLARVGGFDERFPRAFREDSDLALRVQDAGYRLVTGNRCTVHPTKPFPWDASIQQQRGNADDVLMRRVHGRFWRDRAHDHGSRTPTHLATVAAAVTAVVAGARRRPRTALAAAAVWAASTARFTALRVLPGPRDRREVAAMTATSAVIPFAAVAGFVQGWRRSSQPGTVREPAPPRAVLFDRDGTLVHDVPYNGDPDAVSPVAGAREALAALRAAGIRTGVVTNQSGIARGLLTAEQVDAVNRRVDDLLGGFEVWQVCPHGPDDGCDCRKPAPGGLRAALDRLGVAPADAVFIGDIGADVGAARAAGARSVLVPTAATLDVELADAPVTCADLPTAVGLFLPGGRG